MTGREVLAKITSAEKELDKFNLTIAEWRVANGFCPELIGLYAAMGEISRKLQGLKKVADLSSFIDKLAN